MRGVERRMEGVQHLENDDERHPDEERPAREGRIHQEGGSGPHLYLLKHAHTKNCGKRGLFGNVIVIPNVSYRDENSS